MGCVFDGHGGWQVSEMASKVLTEKVEALLDGRGGDTVKSSNVNSNVNQMSGTLASTPSHVTEANLIRIFQETETAYIDSIRYAFSLGFGEVAKVGSCVCLAVVEDDNLVVANLGDCRAVLVSEVDGHMHGAQITRDHNCREPIERLALEQMHPGERDVVVCKPNNPHACYVKGRLQLTRSLGDIYLKYADFNAQPNSHRSSGRHISGLYTPPYVSHVPEVVQLKLQQGVDKRLILATDGVWDFISIQEAAEIVSQHPDANVAATALVQAALVQAAKESNMSIDDLKSLPQGRARRGRHDDTSVVVISLP
jgi:pyruvate dehydrogenase phosphatase